jgi:hypothetical protein
VQLPARFVFLKSAQTGGEGGRLADSVRCYRIWLAVILRRIASLSPNGLKLIVDESRPAWARGLKRPGLHAYRSAELSRPAWARGLKHRQAVAWRHMDRYG